MTAKTLRKSSVLLGACCVLAALLVPVGCTSENSQGSGRSNAADGGSDIAADEGSDITSSGEAAVDAGACRVNVPATAVDAGPCPSGRLVAAPTSTITTPDPWPMNPTLAGSPSGAFLAVWTEGSGNAGTIWASLLQQGAAGTTASPAIELTGNGACPTATWTGTSFAVVWAAGSGLQMQSFDGQGKPVGSPAAVLSGSSGMCPMALLPTAAGLAIATTSNHPVAGGEDIVSESVALIDPSGKTISQVLLDIVGPGVAANVALAEVGGQDYVAFVEWPDTASDTAVARIDWSTGAAATQTTVPGFFQSFVAVGGQLWLSTYGGSGYMLYAALPGASFRTVGQGCSAIDDLAVDSCGRLVGIGSGGFTPGGVAGGFYAQTFGGDGSQATLGAVTESTLAGAGSTFGVLWFARIGPGGGPYDDAHPTGSLSFTTLSWM